MNKNSLAAGTALILGFTMAPSTATYNASATGTVGMVQQMSPAVGYTAESFAFQISPQPSVPCTPWGHRFIISPATVTDAQTRRNMVAMVLAAKAAGYPLTVAYDSTGGYCDQGHTGVYYIAIPN